MRTPRFRQSLQKWSPLSFYQRFESLIAMALTIIVAVIAVVALFRLSMGVFTGLLAGALNPLDHQVFQTVFGEIMTLLIALEFNHTLQYVVTRQQSIIQTSVVLLIALLALARKFIVLDLQLVSPAHLMALSMATLALGLTYWLVRSRQFEGEHSSAP